MWFAMMGNAAVHRRNVYYVGYSEDFCGIGVPSLRRLSLASPLAAHLRVECNWTVPVGTQHK